MKKFKLLRESASDYVSEPDDDKEVTDYKPRSKSEEEFVDLHTIVKTDHPVAGDDQFKASNKANDPKKQNQDKADGDKKPVVKGSSFSSFRKGMKEEVEHLDMSESIEEIDESHPKTLSDAHAEAVKKAVAKIKREKMTFDQWEKTTTFGPKLKAEVKRLMKEEVELDENSSQRDAELGRQQVFKHQMKKRAAASERDRKKKRDAELGRQQVFKHQMKKRAAATKEEVEEVGLEEAYSKSAGFKKAWDSIALLTKALNPNGNLAKGISKGADNVIPEFKKMHKLILDIENTWGEVEYTIDSTLGESIEMEEVELDEEWIDEAFKLDDMVIPKIGPHKGKKHRIIAVKSDNRYTIAPVDIPARSIQYRLGAATANASDLTKYVKEDLDEDTVYVKRRYNSLGANQFSNQVGFAKKLANAANKLGLKIKMEDDKFVISGDSEKISSLKKTVKGVTFTKEEVELDESKSSTGYDIYHRDFSGAMQHAYSFAKKKYRIDIDPDEIDQKVAMGPRKPSEGKTNRYRLEGDNGAIQVQVYNRGGSKPYELNMYKEEVELDESVKAGSLKLSNGKSVNISSADAKAFNEVLSDLNPENKKRMEAEMKKDEASFKKMLTFARNA